MKRRKEREESLDRRLHDFTISLNLAPEFGTDWLLTPFQSRPPTRYVTISIRLGIYTLISLYLLFYPKYCLLPYELKGVEVYIHQQFEAHNGNLKLSSRSDPRFAT